MHTTRSSILAKSCCWLAGMLSLGAGAAAASQAGPAPTAPTPAAPKPAAAENFFDVHEYRVLGNTTLSNRDIETALYPLLGDHKTLADVELARAALEKTYHDRGLATVFVDIPEQTVAEQIVRLKVTEGRLRQVSISGARYFSERKIMAAMPQATAGAVPNVPELQKQLSAINIQTSDRAVVPVLKAGPVPGTVDLALKVDDHLPLHAGIELNNSYTPNTKPLRATVSLSYSNLFAAMDSVSAQYQVAPQETGQVNVFAANYAWAPTTSGFRPSVYFINSNSNVAVVGTLGVIGKGKIFGARFAYPLTDELGMPQSLTFGVDYKRFRESIGLESTAALVTPISYTNLSLGYNGLWNSDRYLGSVGITANFGPRGLPNTSSDFANKRYKGQANYFYVKLESTFVAHLPKGFQLTLRADGQWAAEPLITNENFSISGSDGVRGYLEAETLSDIGIKGSIQVQSPLWQWGETPVGNVFMFFDTGRAGFVDPLPSDPGPSSIVLRSWGAGLNLLPGKWLSGSLTWADPLLSGSSTRRGESRLLFNVRGSF